MKAVTCDIVIEKAQHSSKYLFLVLDLSEEMQPAGLKCIAKLKQEKLLCKFFEISCSFTYC